MNRMRPSSAFVLAVVLSLMASSNAADATHSAVSVTTVAGGETAVTNQAVIDAIKGMEEKITAMQREANARIDSLQSQVERLQKQVAASAPGNQKGRRPGPVPDSLYAMDAGSSPWSGGEHAPVTMVVYFDYRCGYCRAALPTIDRLQEAHKDRLRVVYKINPVLSGEQSIIAFKASIAAFQQGRFREMHDLIFQHSDSLTAQAMQLHAVELKLDMDKYNRAIASTQAAAIVTADTLRASQLHMTAVPSFFLNGRYISGVHPYEFYQTRIEAQLAPLGR
jgi:protein-disulfide isomerase